MNLSTYQKAAMKYSPEGHDRLHYGCLGLIGESGEVVDVVKKHLFRSDAAHAWPGDDMIEELGDVMWYLAELATGMCLEMADELEPVRFYRADHHMDKLEKYAICMAGLSMKCYDFGFAQGNRRNMLTCMKKIYACVKMIAWIGGIPMSTILENNIRKLKRRYPNGYKPQR